MFLRKLPFALALVFFGLVTAEGALTIAKPLLAARLPWFYRERLPALVGVTVGHQKPTFALNSLLHRRFQTDAEWWMDKALVQRASVVRAFNQVIWSAFRDTYMANGSIISGRGGVLFEQSYIMAHCGIGMSQSAASLRMEADSSFARRLRAAQDWFAKRGQLLIYMLGEAKTTWYADRIPSSYPCSPEQRDAIYPPGVAALRAAGVNLVDGRAILESARKHEQVPLFPVNGVHWNWLGAALAANGLLRQVRDLGVSELSPIAYQTMMNPDEPLYSYDRDLSDLLNLVYPPKGAASPYLLIHRSDAPAFCSLVSVSDSFFAQPAALLEEASAFRSIEIYRYLTLGRQLLPQLEQPMDPANPAEYDDIFKADVVVLEEVETRIGGPYALMFLDMVERREAQGTAKVGRVAADGCRDP